MPLDLPPPLPPQLAEDAVLERRYQEAAKHGGVIVLEAGGYRLLVSGNTFLSEQRIREVTSVANTPSQAILLLNALYATEEYPFVNVQYAREDNAKTIWVQVNEGYLAEVDAPPSIEPFFDQFEGETGVTETDLEPMRILAELKSERAGYILTTRYTVDPDRPEEFTLVIDRRENPDHDAAEFSVAFGNPGNRFLGRYFGLAGANFKTDGGAQLGLSVAHGFPQLGRSAEDESRNIDDDRYNQFQLSYNLISSWGLYALSGSYTGYEISDLFNQSVVAPTAEGTTVITFVNDTEEAKIIQGKLVGNQFIHADDDTRWVVEEQLEYVSSVIDIQDGQLVRTDTPVEAPTNDPGLVQALLDLLLGGSGGDEPVVTSASLADQSIQDEQYYAARLGTTFSDAVLLFDNRGSVTLGVGYKRGLSGEINNTLTDQERTAKFNLVDANVGLQVRLPSDLLLAVDLKGQLSLDDRLPQQEQFTLGGPGNLSAYLPGITVGDSGASGRIQLSLPRWKILDRPYRISLFVEGGAARFEGENLPLGRAENQIATDAGVKLEFSPFDWFQITGFVAEGLSTSGIPEEIVERSGADFYFNVKATF